MAQKNELKWGAVLSYAQMALSVIIGLAYTPIMIRLLGRNEYGLYSTVGSTVAMLSILNLGFNSSYVRYFARYRKQNDTGKIYRLNGLFLSIFLVIGAVAFACGLFLTYNLELVFDKGLTEHEYRIAKILMFLMTISLACSFPASVFSSIISANERFVFLKLWGMLNTVMGPMVNLPLLLMGFRSIGLVSSSLALGLITDAVYVYFVIFKLKNKFIFGKVEKGLFSSLFSYTIFIAINMIVDQINNGIDRVLLGRFNGTISVAIYSIGANLYVHYKQISTAISGVFTPRIHRLYNAYQDEKKRNKELTELFVKVGRVQFLILMLIASGIIVFGRAFIRFWVGDGYEDSYYVALLLILPASIPLIQNLGIEIQRAANKHQFRSVAYLIMAVCNLILTIYLCQLYRAIGAAIGTALSLILANGIIMNIYYYKKIGLDIPVFWKNIFCQTCGMLPAFALGIAINLYCHYVSVWHMAAFILLYSAIYIICVWLLSMNSFEKQLISSAIRKVLKQR